MYRRFSLVFWVTLKLILVVVITHGYCTGAPDVTADAAVVLDARTGSILYGRWPYEQRPPASTTKILTAIIALEKGRLSDIVTASPNASYTEGSSIYLQPGEKLTLEELIWGALLESGNDACVAIAEHLSGDEEGFSKLQNRKAKAIGAWDTNFVNPHGLSVANHYTTAYDLGAVARYALRNSKFQEIVRSKEKVPHEPRETRAFFSTNRLLWSYSGCDGVKTGTTEAAGQCLIASASRGGRQLVAVVLHSDDRWSDATALLDYGFDFTRLLKLASAGQVAYLPLVHGLEPVICARSASDLYVTVPKELTEQVVVSWLPLPNLRAPVNRGEKVGEIQVWLRNELLARTNLIAAATVAPKTPLTMLLWYIYRPLLYRLRTWKWL